MRVALLLVVAALTTSIAWGQSATGPDALAGDWTFYMTGDPTPQRVDLMADADSVRGRVYGQPFAAAVDGADFGFRIGGYTWTGTAAGDTLTGEIATGDTRYDWRGVRYRPPAAPRSLSVEPRDYPTVVSPALEPVLRIYPGDTVRASSIDAAGWGSGGYQADGNKRSPGGNPLTGPFYVEGSQRGDVLAVRIHRLRLDRDWAFSGGALWADVLDPAYLRDREADGDLVFWDLDTLAGVARPAEPTPGLADYAVPLTPFLGSVAVAPGRAAAGSSRDSGPYGGNMEYVRVREGATVYLPVGEEGAYLYLGDAHAVQGDGELTGDALETSAEVAFTVKVQRYRFREVPRVEDDAVIASVGIAGSLDRALEQATTDMARWLESDYGLTSGEAALVLGTVARFRIPDVVGPWVSVALEVDKVRLEGLGR